MDGFDLTQTVPDASMSFMMLGIGIAVFVPILFYRGVAGRWKGQLLSMFLGILAYATLDMLIVNTLVVLPLYIPGVLNFMDTHGAVLLIYQLILSGVLLESGRLFFIYVMHLRAPEIGDPARMAVGYGGAEALLTVALGLFLNLTMASAINQQGLSLLMEGLGSEAIEELMTTTVNPLLNTPAYYYLMLGVEAAAKVLFHIAQSLLLFVAVSNKGPKWLFAVAVCCRMLLLLPVALFNQGAYSNMVLSRVFVLLAIAVTCALAYFVLRRWDPESLKKQEKQIKVKINTRAPGGNR